MKERGTRLAETRRVDGWRESRLVDLLLRKKGLVDLESCLGGEGLVDWHGWYWVKRG